MLRLQKIVGGSFILLLAALVLLFSAPVQAANSTQCTVTGLEANGNPYCTLVDLAVQGPSASKGSSASYLYTLARSRENVSNPSLGLGFPIDAWDVCRYLDNSTPASIGGLPTVGLRGVLLVPFGSAAEWTISSPTTGFINTHNNPGGSFYAVPCARPQTTPVTVKNTDGSTATSTTDGTNPVQTVTVIPNCYGHITVRDSNDNVIRPLTVDPSTQTNTIARGASICGPSTSDTLWTSVFHHTRQDCNSANICNTVNWDETFKTQCTATQAADTGPTKDGAFWDCRVVSRTNPIPPQNIPPLQNCGTHNSGDVYWTSIGQDSRAATEPPAANPECPYGSGTRRLIWTNQRETQCLNGTETATGNTRQIDQHWEGLCTPQQPQCIFRDGSGNVTQRNASECCLVPSNLTICGTAATGLQSTLGTNLTLTLSGGYNRREAYSCWKVGNDSNTGLDIFSFIGSGSTGVCSPQMCGSHSSGTTYWLTGAPATSTVNSTPTVQECPAGGVKMTSYTNEDEYSCDNGVQTATGNHRQVNPVVALECNQLTCSVNGGNVPNGSTYWVCAGTSSSTRAASSAECAAGGTVTTTVTNQDEWSCNNGHTGPTGRHRQINPVDTKTCNPAMCGNNASGSKFWVAINDTQYSRAATSTECPAGGTAQITNKNEAELLCNNGSTSATGNVRIVDSTVVLSCNPSSCGSHANGTTYWKPIASRTTTRASTVDECPYGGTTTVVTDYEAEYTCHLGLEICGTSTRVVGSHVSGKTCNPPPAMCGTHNSGTSWTVTAQNSSTVAATTQQCTYGGTVTSVTTTNTTYRCDNGVQTQTNQTQSVQVQSPVCNVPQSCGSHASGSNWSVDTTRNYTCAASTQQCQYGGTSDHTVTTTTSYHCENGTTTTTGSVDNDVITANHCNVPQSCNGHASGSSWSVDSTVNNTVNATVQQCPYGGTVTSATITTTSYRCDNGATTQTGQTQRVVQQEPICNQPQSCGSHAHNSNWSVDTTRNYTCAASTQQCTYGGTSDHTVTTTTSYHCANGVQTTTGSVDHDVVTANHCNQPRSCGNTASGQTIWVNTTNGSSSRAANGGECQYGGTVGTTWTNQAEQLCTDGTLTNTGATRQVNIVVGAPVCNVPQSCGGHASGTTWNVDSSRNYTCGADAGQCSYGGTSDHTVTTTVTYSCTNGVTTQINSVDRDVVTANHCNQPASCNGHASGTTWTADSTSNSSGAASAQQCPYGGTAYNAVTTTTTYSCNNGSTNQINQTQSVSTSLNCNGNPAPVFGGGGWGDTWSGGWGGSWGFDSGCDVCGGEW